MYLHWHTTTYRLLLVCVYTDLDYDEEDQEVWTEEEGEVMTDFQVKTGRGSECDELPDPLGNETRNTTSAYKSLCLWLVAFLLHIQAQFHLTDRVIGSIVKFLGVFLRVLGRPF